MRTFTTKFMLFFFGALLHIGISAKVNAADYFPLKVGNCWVYSPSYGEGLRIDSIVGTEMIRGKYRSQIAPYHGVLQTYIWKRTEAPPDNYLEKRWLAKSPDGTVVEAFKIWGNEGVDPSTPPMALVPPWIVAKQNTYVGDSWQVEGELESIHYKATYEVLSTDDEVEVPVGTFQHCIRIQSLDELTQDGYTKSTVHEVWLAPDIGPVMYLRYQDDGITPGKRQKLVGYSFE